MFGLKKNTAIFLNKIEATLYMNWIQTGACGYR